MCRQYNDYGSTQRDRVEGNLNSINFPEFYNASKANDDCATSTAMRTVKQNTDQDALDHLEDGSRVSNGGTGAVPQADKSAAKSARDDEKRKRELLVLAEYERSCLDLALGELAKEASDKVMDALNLFVNVTDLYGQIYVARDIGSWTK